MGSLEVIRVESLHRNHEEAIHRHIRWYRDCPAWYRHKWKECFDNPATSSDAVFEACVCDMLCRQVDIVRPADEPGHLSPDFLCIKGNCRFYVEATAIDVEAATRKSRLPEKPDGVRNYKRVTNAIYEKCVAKAKQCAAVDVPALLAVGTLHFQVAAVCLQDKDAEWVLTGTPRLAAPFNPATGQVESPLSQVSELEGSVFLRAAPQRYVVEEGHRSIAAVLLCGFGAPLAAPEPHQLPWHVYGALNPQPNHHFDRNLLPRIPFCKLSSDWRAGDLAVEPRSCSAADRRKVVDNEAVGRRRCWLLGNDLQFGRVSAPYENRLQVLLNRCSANAAKSVDMRAP